MSAIIQQLRFYLQKYLVKSECKIIAIKISNKRYI